MLPLLPSKQKNVLRIFAECLFKVCLTFAKNSLVTLYRNHFLLLLEGFFLTLAKNFLATFPQNLSSNICHKLSGNIIQQFFLAVIRMFLTFDSLHMQQKKQQLKNYFLTSFIFIFTLKPSSRQPAVCCCVVAAACMKRGGRPGLLDRGFKMSEMSLNPAVYLLVFLLCCRSKT